MAAFTLNGEFLCAMEDIGRHNAVDKIVGNLINGNPDPNDPCTDIQLPGSPVVFLTPIAIAQGICRDREAEGWLLLGMVPGEPNSAFDMGNTGQYK